MELKERHNLKILGHIPPGLPPFEFPKFSIERGNETIGFLQMCSEMGSGIFVLPLIALLENIAICKAFGKILLFKNFFS